MTYGRFAELVWVNASRFLKVRYRGSVLGVYWSLSSPLFMTAVYTAVFGAAFRRYYGDSTTGYALASLTGLALLTYFTSTTSMALTTVVHNGGLLNKVAAPPSIFPVATVAANSFQLLVGVTPLLAILTLLVTHRPLHVLALVVPLLAIVLIALGFALIVSALYVYFRDLPHLYELFTFVLFVTSPVFYPAALVPSAVRAYVRFNPLAAVIECVRAIVLGGGDLPYVAMVQTFGIGVLVVAVGTGVFSLLRRGFMDLL